MAGVLSFTLGLEASNFIRQLGVASGSVLSFAGLVQGVRFVSQQMWSAIEHGGNLKDLAAAATMGVDSLYALREGFLEVGASADSVGSLVSKARRMLASGEQVDLLKSMGLDPAALAQSDPVAQISAISDALSRVKEEFRDKAAFDLFGREGATTMMQIANSGQDWARAVERAAKDAQVWRNVAPAFDQIGDQVREIQAHLKTMAATAAGAIVGAWQQGRIPELIGLSFQVGFEKAIRLASASMQGIVQLITATLGSADLFKAMYKSMGAALVGLGTSLMEGTMGPLADWYTDKNHPDERKDFDARQNERRAHAEKLANEAGDALVKGIREVEPKIVAALRQAYGAVTVPSDAQNALENLVSDLIKNLGEAGEKAKPKATTEPDFKDSNGNSVRRNDATALEKIGLVMNDRGGGFQNGVSELRQIVQQGAKQIRVLQEIERNIKPADYSNLA